MEARAQQRLERKKALDEKKRKAEEEKLVCEHPLLLLFAAFAVCLFHFKCAVIRAKMFREFYCHHDPTWSNVMYFFRF